MKNLFALICVTCLLFTLTLPVGAFTAMRTDGTYGIHSIKNEANGLYLNLTAPQGVSLATGNGSNNQKWVVQFVFGGSYQIRCYNPVNNSIGTVNKSNTNNSAVISTGTNIPIRVHYYDDETVTFTLEMTNLVLAASGNNVVWQEFDTANGNNINNPTAAQKWKLEPDTTYKQGDVNMNGKIDTGDALEILKCVAGLRTFTAVELYLADLSRTDNFGTANALEILKYAAGLPSIIDW
jgi:hypothetical protein